MSVAEGGLRHTRGRPPKCPSSSRSRLDARRSELPREVGPHRAGRPRSCRVPTYSLPRMRSGASGSWCRRARRSRAWGSSFRTMKARRRRNASPAPRRSRKWTLDPEPRREEAYGWRLPDEQPEADREKGVYDASCRVALSACIVLSSAVPCIGEDGSGPGRGKTCWMPVHKRPQGAHPPKLHFVLEACPRPPPELRHGPLQVKSDKLLEEVLTGRAGIRTLKLGAGLETSWPTSMPWSRASS